MTVVRLAEVARVHGEGAGAVTAPVPVVGVASALVHLGVHVALRRRRPPPSWPRVVAEAALEWAKKIAASCRCSQEVRAFQYDPLT